MNGRLTARRRRHAAGPGDTGPGGTGSRLRAVVQRYWRLLALAAAILVVAGIALSIPVGPTGDQEAARSGTPGGRDAGTPTSAPASASTEPAQPAPTSAARSAMPASSTDSSDRRPDPYIRDFARQPGVTPLPPQPSPTAGVPLPGNVNGCDFNYGDVGQCIPAQFPASVTDRCGWLARQGLVSIPVTGVDRHGLDVDGDGLACEPDERP